MSFDPGQFREYVDGVLRYLNREIPYSLNARELLVLTSAAETELGRYLWQIGGSIADGPARGVFQMEIATEEGILKYLEGKPSLKAMVDRTKTGLSLTDMVHSLAYQTAMARVYYWTKPGALPDYRDYEAMAQYWKRHWNTFLGKGTVEGAIEMYLNLAGNLEK